MLMTIICNYLWLSRIYVLYTNLVVNVNIHARDRNKIDNAIS